jgi:copper(I)-binding protein
MTIRALTIGFALALMALAQAFAAAPTISIEGAWARPSLGAGGASAAYFTIHNTGTADDTLTGASSPTGSAALHESRMEGGIMKMLPLESVAIPAGGTVSFAPGGKHVMLTGLKSPLTIGQTLTLTLNFKKAGPVAVQVPVRNAAPAAMPGMDMH